MKGCSVIVLSVFSVVASSAIFCSQCDSDTNPHCIDNPPVPQNCTSCERFDPVTTKCVAYLPLAFCQIERRYMNSTLIRLRRDCIPAMMRTTCKTVLEYGEEIEVCFETCNTNGCNSNMASPLHQHHPSSLFLLLISFHICKSIVLTNT